MANQDWTTIFEDIDLLLIGISILIAVLLLAFLIAITFVDSHYYKHYVSRVKDSINSLRVFIIDVNNDKVQYFNRTNLKKRRTFSITDFYNQFPANERERVINWIGNLIDKDQNVPKFIEINVMFAKSSRNYFSVLQAQKIDYNKSLIYLESYLLKYLTVSHNKNKKISYKFTSLENFTRAINLSNNKGTTICFNFFDKKTLNPEISHISFAHIKNVLAPYISNKLAMLEYDEHEIIVSNLKNSTKMSNMQLISTIRNEINRTLSISSNEDNVGFVIGVVEHRYFPKDADKIIQTSLSLSNIAREDGEEIIIYDEDRQLDSSDESKNYRTEVERIVQDRRLQYLYIPIYDVERERILGYQMDTKPLDSFFDSIDELKNYAVRTDDDKELFATIARNGISRFIEERDGKSYKLFFPISVYELNYVNRTVSHIQSIKEIKLVFVLDENDLRNLPEGATESLLVTIHTLKTKGYEIALAMYDSKLTLSPSIYEVFDDYLLSVKSHISKKSAGRQLPSFQALIEKLLHYQKNIIAVDIPTWDIVELVIKFGINIVSSEAIAPFDENVLPISPKCITKLKNIDN